MSFVPFSFRIFHGPIAICLSLLATTSANGQIDVRSKPKPNIVMICVDDLNGWVGYLANETESGLLDVLIDDPKKRQRLKDFLTPNIDRLAESGVAFTRAYCNCPLCGPSRVSFLTGLHPSTTGYYDHNQHFRTAVRDGDKIVTLPQYLRQQGYLTVEAGKVFHTGRGGDPSKRSDERSDPQSWSAQHVQYIGTNWRFTPTRVDGKHCSGNPWQYDPSMTVDSTAILGHAPEPDGAQLSKSQLWHGGKISGEYFSKSFCWGVLPEPGNEQYDPREWSTLETTFDYRQADYVANFFGSLSPGLAEHKFLTDIDPTVGHVVGGLAARREDQPFFIAYGSQLPHNPFIVPSSFAKSLNEIISPDDLNIAALDRLNQSLFGNEESNTKGQIGKIARHFANLANLHQAVVESGEEKHNDRYYYWRQALFMYLASVNFSDACVGRVLEGVDASPEKDNTIVIMLSDHGWHLGTKRHWSKMTLWEEANHIPFIIKAPGIKPAKCRQPVDLLSIFSTVLELAELPAPNEVNPEHQILDSQSLVPLLNKPDEGPDRTVVFSYNYSFRLRAFAAVNKRWKLIHYSHTGEEELYDLKNDPFELKNIIRNQSTASSLARRGYRSLRETIKAETINSARGLQALNPNTPVAFTTIADDTDRP